MEVGIDWTRSPMSDLHNAARNGDMEALQAQIAANAGLDEKDQHSRTPLHMAAWSGQTVRRQVRKVSESLSSPLSSAFMAHYLPICPAHAPVSAWPPALMSLSTSLAPTRLAGGREAAAGK